MSLSNTATPKYYGQFRDAVLRGEIPVCREVAMEMNRIDELIANPGVYYDDEAVEGWIKYCENELTLTDEASRFFQTMGRRSPWLVLLHRAQRICPSLRRTRWTLRTEANQETAYK